MLVGSHVLLALQLTDTRGSLLGACLVFIGLIDEDMVLAMQNFYAFGLDLVELT